MREVPPIPPELKEVFFAQRSHALSYARELRTLIQAKQGLAVQRLRQRLSRSAHPEREVYQWWVRVERKPVLEERWMALFTLGTQIEQLHERLSTLKRAQVDFVSLERSLYASIEQYAFVARELRA